MLFHACWVIYTVKELDSHAKHCQNKKIKKRFGHITVFLCIHRISSNTPGFLQVSESFFSIMALPDVMKGGTPCMDTSLRRARPRTQRPARAQECTHQRASFGCTARDSLGNNISKEVCFWLWGKDNLVQLPEEPSVTWTVDIVCFSGAATEFWKYVCWRTFYKQGPVRRWICTSFDTERWSGPSYKRSRSWFRTADGKWNGIKCLCFVGNRSSCARHSLAPPTEHLQELGCFRRES